MPYVLYVGIVVVQVITTVVTHLPVWTMIGTIVVMGLLTVGTLLVSRPGSY